MDTALRLLVLAAILALVYAAACAVRPWGRCGRCRGRGRIEVGGRRARLKKCPRCRGTKIRLRIGRRIYNHLHKTRARATA